MEFGFDMGIVYVKVGLGMVGGVVATGNVALKVCGGEVKKMV